MAAKITIAVMALLIVLSVLFGLTSYRRAVMAREMAMREQARARAQEDRARAAEERARTAIDFMLQAVLVDPKSAPAAVTVDDVLQRAAARLDDVLKDDPELAARLHEALQRAQESGK